jgi:ubiquinone/menaquinone biosynthesis C-methylase UbiE
MLSRTLEPEVMDTAEEAADYDSMDHSAVNRVFVDDFVAAFSSQLSAVSKEEVGDRRSEVGREPRTVLDVGTGTALIPIELASRRLGFHITAIDLAEEMLRLGQVNVERAGPTDCITLALVDAKGLPYADATFDAVMSNSIVHHIPEPRGTLAEMWRVLRPGGLLFVRDLLRPETSEKVERIVATYAGTESPRQQQLFRQSLHAALTVEEVGELLTESGIGVELNGPHPGPPSGTRGDAERCVRQTSDRHWTIVARR